ncbi:hypothetical protein IW146_001797 [Coemansia sp. RSA 922]|nr:hypothetical protein H4S03_001688 [Coemansia sp. S3946]KAJ2051493.1 hypothetical protein H4S04_001951 [Coemansia sp. S16]KAJ2116101.1 hypothetical protein IW146_001797 [Coemansia sp. RSA 922]KAJ2343236.1 hypothetical protein GGH92_005019 [Coemansia sp. RSA 2673]
MIMLLKYISAIALLIDLCCAQVEMREPPPRRSKFSKFYITADDVDYNMKSPLGGKNGYPCRKSSPGPVQGTLVAGQDLKVFFDGMAARQGGDCQFAVSYDNGTSFAVIWDKLGNCFLDTVNGGYEVPIPDKLPASKSAIFAWTWIPATGQRPFFMNCADVRIENYGKQESYTGKELLVVNVPGKPILAIKRFESNDTLPALLEARPLITVGEPAQTEDEILVDSSKTDDAAENNGEDGDTSGVVILYVSESTSTMTHVVYVSEYITEADTDLNALYSYGRGIQTKGAPSVALGPYVKPLFGTNVGLTIAPAETPTTTDGLPVLMTFTNDWASKPSGSAKWLGTDQTNYFPPSLPGPRPTSPTSASADLWSASVQSSVTKSGQLVADSTYPAGTPLFPTTHVGPSSIGKLGSLASEFSLGSAELAGLISSNTVVTNRPDFRSVTDQARVIATNHVHQSLAAAVPHARTMLSTVTKNGKPMLQVVVSVDSTAIPESLTIAYSAPA